MGMEVFLGDGTPKEECLQVRAKLPNRSTSGIATFVARPFKVIGLCPSL